MRNVAGFIKATEGVQEESWQARLDKMGTGDPVQAMADVERRMASNLKAYLRALDDDETGPSTDQLDGTPHARAKAHLKNGALQAVLGLDLQATSETSETGQNAAPAAIMAACASNFCATGRTEHTRTEATATPRGDTIHVAVHMELGAPMLSLDVEAQSSQLLHVPYRSMTAQLGVKTLDGMRTLTAVIDSGAAQSAVSARWLRAHPDLWDSRISSHHRFHGITGEPLHVDGVVRLDLQLGGYSFSTWAHVFTSMKSELLLGTNAIIENALVIDGGDCTVYPKKDPSAAVAVTYRLSTHGDMLQLNCGSTCVQQLRMKPAPVKVFGHERPAAQKAGVRRRNPK